MIMLMSSPEVLVVVEDGRANRLLRSFLTDYIVINSLLEVSWIKLRNAKVGLIEHRATPGFDGRVIGICEARVEVRGPP